MQTQNYSRKLHENPDQALKDFRENKISLEEYMEGFPIEAHLEVCQIRRPDFKTLYFLPQKDDWFVDMIPIIETAGLNRKKVKNKIINKFGQNDVFRWVDPRTGQVRIFISQSAAVFLSELVSPISKQMARWIITSLCRAESLDFDFSPVIEERMNKRMQEAEEKNLGVFKRTQIKLFRKLGEIKNYILAHIRVEAK